MCKHKRTYEHRYIWDRVEIHCLECKEIISKRVYTQDDWYVDHPPKNHYKEYVKFQRMIDTWD